MQDVSTPTTCHYCGRPLEYVPGHRRREYCNDVCRQAGHRRRKEQTARDERLRAVRALGTFLPETQALLEGLFDVSPELAERVAQAIDAEVQAVRASQPIRDETHVTIAAEELASIPDWYRHDDPQPRPFKAWLRAYYPPPKQQQKRRVFDPLHQLATRLLADERMPERASKNEYLVLLQRYQYDSSDLRYFHNLWIELLQS